MKTVEERLFDLYCEDLITENELKERLEAEHKKSIERYLNLFLEGHITKDDLITVLSE